MADNPTSDTPLDAEALKAQAVALSQLASHPGFLGILKEIEDAPEAERLATAERLANLQTLRQRGVPIPDTFRLTTRYFENPNSDIVGSVRIDKETPQTVNDDEFDSAITICGSLGYFVCGSIGGQPLTDAVRKTVVE